MLRRCRGEASCLGALQPRTLQPLEPRVLLGRLFLLTLLLCGSAPQLATCDLLVDHATFGASQEAPPAPLAPGRVRRLAHCARHHVSTELKKWH
tara:strand:+ start:2174 stop:2455 length:282 start_codon:yes stop_codon:yes gene_type:complete